MAQEFPDAEIWGWDRPHVREIWTGTVPSNCRFDTAPNYDFLESFEDEFDLIHMRFVARGVGTSHLLPRNELISYSVPSSRKRWKIVRRRFDKEVSLSSSTQQGTSCARMGSV